MNPVLPSSSSVKSASVRRDLQALNRDAGQLQRDTSADMGMGMNDDMPMSRKPMDRDTLWRMQSQKEAVTRAKYEQDYRAKLAAEAVLAADVQRMQAQACETAAVMKAQCAPVCPPKVECPKPCPPCDPCPKECPKPCPDECPKPCPDPCDVPACPDPCDPCANKGYGKWMWVYLLVAVIVLIIIFVVAARQDKKCRNLSYKGVEWANCGSGKVIMGIFLVIALLLLAWACAAVTGQQLACCMKGRAWLALALFVVIIVLVLIAFIQFFRGSFKSAYWLMVAVLVLALIATILFAYWRATGPAVAMGLFTIWSIVIVWLFQRVKCQNHGHGSKSGRVVVPPADDATSSTSH